MLACSTCVCSTRPQLSSESYYISFGRSRRKISSESILIVNMASAESPLGALDILPPEIRELIYGYLTPPARLPITIRSRQLGVSGVSHRPPPLSFLLASRPICHEALAVYYRKCVFKFEGLLDPANICPLWGIEELLGGSEAGVVTLANMRQVELNLFWHRLPDGGIEQMSEGGGVYEVVSKSEVEKRVERLGRAVQVLRRAERLQNVHLTWKEIPMRLGEEGPNNWDVKEKVLNTLSAFGGVRIKAGDIVASNEVELSILQMIDRLNISTLRPKHHSRVRSRAYVSLSIGLVNEDELIYFSSWIW